MKHQWKTNEYGEIEPLDELADHPITQCVVCGQTSGCLHAQDPGSYRSRTGEEPRLDADDCEGLDLFVEVNVTIRHPGKATAYDDRCSVGQSWRVPLAMVMDARVDLVERELAHLSAAMTEQWRVALRAHFDDWKRATAEEPS